MRKLGSSLSTLLFVRGYKPQAAAGGICQHVNVTSAGVRHGNAACLISSVYHNYRWTLATAKMLVAIQAPQQQFCRQQGGQSLRSCGLRFLFRWTRRRCGRGEFWSILSQPQAKQAHVFHSTASLLLPSFLRSSESTDKDRCLTSRRIHHCWASCLEMLMLLCGFFRTLGQRLPHQMYLSFAALSQSALYSRCNLFSASDKPEGPQR